MGIDVLVCTTENTHICKIIPSNNNNKKIKKVVKLDA